MAENKTAKPIRILYYGGGWPTNIGNAFIDLGAMALLRAAAPNSEIAFASEMPRWFFGHSIKEPVKSFFRRRNQYKYMNNAFDVASVIQCDLVVFAGMAMCEEFIQVNGPTVLGLSSRSKPVLLLGTGGSTYSEDECKIYREFLRRLSPIGFISRDRSSYKIYKDLVAQSYEGIDCAFFLPEAYTPPLLTLPPYVVLTFDDLPEPLLSFNTRSVIRAHHDCWSPRPGHISTNNTLISDIPYDYLALYANAEEIYTDRVHACIASLAYGSRTRLYNPTMRGSLFDAVGAEGIRDKLVQLDMQLLAKKKRAQVEFVCQLIATNIRQ